MAFELSRELFQEIVEHCRGGLPNEACGIVAGDGGRAVQVYRMRNSEESPVVYRFDAQEQFEVMKELDEKGWEPLAFFHSHTHTEAYPSPTDRAHAHWRDPVTRRGGSRLSRHQLSHPVAGGTRPGAPGVHVRGRGAGRGRGGDRMSFSADEVRRYARHIILPGIGGDGQQRLKESSVLVIGAGGLGSPAAMYLAAAGVGKIGLVDFDAVELSNLQRQLLHGTDDVGRPKVASGADRLRELNPNVEVVTHQTLLSSENAFDVLGGYDIVVDGTDNFPVRYLVNDATQMLRKPLVYGSIYQWEGQASVFLPGPETPCYRCLFPEPPPPGTVPSCAEGGVFGVLPGIIGSIQAVEAIKLAARGGGDARRQAGAVRRDAQRVHHGQAAVGPGLPGVRETPLDHRADRLRGVLRPGAGRGPPEAEHTPRRGRTHDRRDQAAHDPPQAHRRGGRGQRRRRHASRGAAGRRTLVIPAC